MNLHERFPYASRAFIAANNAFLVANGFVAPRLPRDQPQPQQRAKQMGDEGTAQKSAKLPVVIITRCSTGSLDRDNLSAAAKAIVDALRYSGYIAGDRESDIELITLQRKVKRGETGTLIEILP